MDIHLSSPVFMVVLAVVLCSFGGANFLESIHIFPIEINSLEVATVKNSTQPFCQIYEVKTEKSVQLL